MIGRLTLLCLLATLSAGESMVVEVPRSDGPLRITLDPTAFEVTAPAITGLPIAPTAMRAAAMRLTPAAAAATAIRGVGQHGQPLLVTRQLVVRLAEHDLAGHGLRLVGRFDWNPELLVVEPVAPGPLAGLQSGADLRALGVEVDEQIGRRLRLHGTVPSDPLVPQQWHLVNTGSGQVAGGVAGSDIHIAPYWTTGSPLGGAGLNIAVVDDGIEAGHEDFVGAINSAVDFDYLSNDTNPEHVTNDLGHGTVVGGLIGARRNSVGGVGVAYASTLVPLRLIPTNSGTFITDAQVAGALGHRSASTSSVIAVSNNSWGPELDGTGTEAIGLTIDTALQSGVIHGRSGRGTVYVFSAGNGNGLDRMDYNEFANDRRVIAVGALGPDGNPASYSEHGLAVLVAAPGGGDDISAMVSCDRSDAGSPTRGFEAGNYTSVTPASAPAVANGTSFSAPLVSGTAALLIEANPQLSWRDVPWLLALTARPIGTTTLNAAGLRFNDSSGAGLIDVSTAVVAAATWVPLPPVESYSASASGGIIPDNSAAGLTASFDLSAVPSDFVVERAVLTINATHATRGQLSFRLVSPGGTTVLVEGRSTDANDNYSNLSCTSVWTMGEGGQGNWSLTALDQTSGDTGNLGTSTLTLYGYRPYRDCLLYTSPSPRD